MSQTEIARLAAVLAKQRAAFTAALPEPLGLRRDRIDRAIALLVDHKDAFAKAVSADFGHRSTEQTLMTEYHALGRRAQACEEAPCGVEPR